MCSVNKGAQAFVFVTDTYKQLTRIMFTTLGHYYF